MVLHENDVVLFSGDSITDGNRGRKMDPNHIMGHGYPELTAAALALENAHARPKFINKGHSGYTMGDLLNVWQEDVLDNRPTVVSLLAGVNDGFCGFRAGKTVEQIVRGYRENLHEALRRTFDALDGVRVVLLEPFYFRLDRSDRSYRLTPHVECEAPYPRLDDTESEACRDSREASIQLLQQEAREAAARFGCTFVPLQNVFAAAMADSAPEYFIWDGTHPTIAGHALISGEWLRAMR